MNEMTLTVSNLSPAAIGAGHASGPGAGFVSDIFFLWGEMHVSVTDLLTPDELPLDVDLAAMGSLDFDVSRKLVGYASLEDQAADDRFLEAAWPGETPAVVPLVAIGASGAPTVGSVHMLSAADIPAGRALFDILLNAGIDAYESDEDRALEVPSVGFGSRPYVDLPGEVDMGDAGIATLTAYDAPAATLDVDVTVTPHLTGYHFDYAAANLLDRAAWPPHDAAARADFGADAPTSSLRVVGKLTHDTRVTFRVFPPAVSGITPEELAGRAQDDIKRLIYTLTPALQDAGLVKISEPSCPACMPRMVAGRPVETAVEYTLTWRQGRQDPSPLV